MKYVLKQRALRTSPYKETYNNDHNGETFEMLPWNRIFAIVLMFCVGK